MNKREIIERLKNIARHAVHIVGEEPFVMSLDDGIAVNEAIELLEKSETDCSEIPNNSDIISRQMAIDALRTCYDTDTVTMDNGDEYINYEDTVGEIEQLPSIQPERKTGRWIPTYEDCCADVWVKWKCSECGYVRKKGWKQTYDGAKPDALFCEMCNADMRGEGVI